MKLSPYPVTCKLRDWQTKAKNRHAVEREDPRAAACADRDSQTACRQIKQLWRDGIVRRECRVRSEA